ncbi:MAG TPA: hypothetical protein VFX96_11560 [Pyrinomonadaceae bacterium]|nr:hypothetical protein [Pyrinomonadaceae bacterium]
MRAARRYAALAVLATLLVALIPHLYFFIKRGAEWNGTFPLTHSDEVVYASYLKARIDGRPRRADPYTGRDDSTATPQPESYFSIQFLPPSVLANVARAVGASSGQTFFALTFLAAAATALALFWMVSAVTGDARTAALTTIITLSIGSAHLVANYLLTGESSYNYLAFLRRYVPSAPFPFLFLFCGAVWRALRAATARDILSWAALAGACFASLVYSYFYLWTAALAWLACLAMLGLVFDREGRGRWLKTTGVVAALCAVSLIPYFALLNNRVASTDVAMSLVSTRRPDLFRLTELLGLIALAGVVFAAVARREENHRGALIFTAALGLTPFVVFNQQVLTGRSLQPFHYGTSSVNYVVVAAVCLSAALVIKTLSDDSQRRAARVFALVAAAALLAGCYEGLLSGRRHLAGNALRDSALPAFRALAREARVSRRLDTEALVLCTDVTVADALTTVAPQPVLWSPHMINFPGAGIEEDRERLLLYLYLSGVPFDDVEAERFEELDRARKYFLSALIGRGRHNPSLRVDWTPITTEEVRGALARWAEFVATLDREQVARLPLAYVLVSKRQRADLANLERWYERDAGEQFGDFTLYRVRLRDAR